jgi:hypothetical protein
MPPSPAVPTFMRGWRLSSLIAAAGIALLGCLHDQRCRAAKPEETSESTSESSSETQEDRSVKKSSRRTGVRASASASGMMSGSASGHAAQRAFGNGQTPRTGSRMGSLGEAGSHSTLRGEMKMQVSVSTNDDDENDDISNDEELQVDDRYAGSTLSDGKDADDVRVSRRFDRGQRITTIERAGETITINDTPRRIVVHRIDHTVDPPASSYLAAASPKALAAKDPAAYDLYERHVLQTPIHEPDMANPGFPRMPSFRGMPDLPRTGNPEMDRMLNGFFNDQQ